MTILRSSSCKRSRLASGRSPLFISFLFGGRHKALTWTYPGSSSTLISPGRRFCRSFESLAYGYHRDPPPPLNRYPLIMPPTQPRPVHSTPHKPDLMMDRSPNRPNPSQWLNFSLPPRQRHVPGSGIPGSTGIPRRSRRGESWRGGAMSRERYVHANFRFVLKPTEVGSYGAHFADPDM